MHKPRIAEIKDALGNRLFVAMCPDCYNGSPRRDREDAVQDCMDHASNPVSNIRERRDFTEPTRGEGPNLGEWASGAASPAPAPVSGPVPDRQPGKPGKPGKPEEMDPETRRRAEAMARFNSALGRMP
jgi:hypothetical protein